MNSGEYKFEKPETVEERPTVSLYNLLDHSFSDLLCAQIAFKNEADRIYDQRERMPEAYTSLCAWSLLFEAAAKEVQDRDSEAWADKTAKEINEETK
jgi:hypothetical protein